MRLIFKALWVLVTSVSTVLCQSNSKLTFEAEDAVLSGTTIESADSGFSGKGYVTGFEQPTDKPTFRVESSNAQLEKRASIVLNNARTSEVLLEVGTTIVDIVLVDYISLTPSPPRPPHKINDALINPSADGNSKKLYSYLKSIYGKKILSGQHDPKYADLIRTQTRKTPTIFERGSKSATVEDAISHHKQGGIVAAQWHWNAPTGLFDTQENPWWSGFYTKATDFDVTATLQDTVNANYTLLIRDIDAIAVQLKRLQDARIPVLWWPLHEAEGEWFWWGAKSAAPAKQLWGVLFDRLTKHHGLNNLIWVWNSIVKEWYTGDDTVDILSADVHAEGNGPMSTQYNQMVELGRDTKLIAAAEIGGAPLPDLLQTYQTDWLYFAVGGDQYINNAEWNSPEALKQIYNHEYVLTLDEIQRWQT
ncbi:GH26 endo-beta-1,4-mannanase [Eremomyces bilateralis CBS 781.70]|uniref:GH26 endo-beta-1,4-mannanase n=1 Tax=Eremomyces bilateralis CBS 781.70 TaxID=1392243 RepID=A0A6G1FZA6_9PEZI|nr:GH26 endo-beta-1,4-mannanase [Eremomyces bilateralis CBS 781.70]KAF1811124.1 GH26 endo-beta-1,4-mannanase [Eremomyces bilateralis CBS 781.70]